MNELNKNEWKSEILLYAIVGISCFAFWYGCFAFVLNDFNTTNWEEGSRFGLVLASAVTLLIFAMFRDLTKAK